MMTNSPLGKYAPIVAAITCVGIISAFVFALLFGKALNADPQSITLLGYLAAAAFGAVTGSAVAVNGWKQPLQSVHDRVDALEIATGIPTHTASTTNDAS